MTPQQLIKHYGDIHTACKALGKTYTCVRTWERNGHIPIWSQWAIQAITEGKLKVSRR